MTDTTPASSHSHDITTLLDPLRAADAALALRVKALEDKVTPPVDPPPVDPPPVTGKVVQFPGTGARTSAAFLALVADLSIDSIEWAPGTYPWASAVLVVARPATRPLLVFTRGAVVWDGTGTANTPPWYVGNAAGAKAAYITFDARAFGGSFTAANYRLGKVGLIFARNFDHIAFHGIKLVNVGGDLAVEPTGVLGPQHTHGVYLKTDPAWRSQWWASDDWEVIGPANRMLNGLQIDGSGGGVDHVHATGWKVENLHRWLYLWGIATDAIIDGWTGKNSDATVDNYSATNAAGKVSNCHATNCGPLAPGSGYWKAGTLGTDGGNTAT